LKLSEENSLNTDENVFPLLLPVKNCWKLLLFIPKNLFFFHSQNPFQLCTIIKPLHIWFLETANFRFWLLNNLFLLVSPMKSWALRFCDNSEKVNCSFQRTTPLNTDENVFPLFFCQIFYWKFLLFWPNIHFSLFDHVHHKTSDQLIMLNVMCGSGFLRKLIFELALCIKDIHYHSFILSFS
jgi:hypothetical protein